eukprot:COSAG01_NODE_35981_length_524_cov_0.701176_1_plen_83_part_10
MISCCVGQIAEWAFEVVRRLLRVLAGRPTRPPQTAETRTELARPLPACPAAPSLPDRTHETLTSELTSKSPSHLFMFAYDRKP